MFTRLLTDPVWYFYQFWFAKYLYGERGVSQLGLSITFVIFLAADFGALAVEGVHRRVVRLLEARRACGSGLSGAPRGPARDRPGPA